MDLAAIHTKCKMSVWYSQFTTHAKFAHTVEHYSGHPRNKDTLIHKTHVTVSNTVCAYTPDL